MRTKEEILKGENESQFLLKCSLRPDFFFERVLGKTLKPFHKEWFQILNTYKRIVISAPTGFGKTSIFGVAYPIWLAFFRPNSQSLIISKNIKTQSSNVLEEIKSTIEDNEILKQMLPVDKKQYWTKEKINTNNGSKIFYSSYTQNVRGTHVDYVFCDEISTFPETQLFFRDVTTRVIAKGGTIAAVSTCLTTTDLLAQLMKNPAYFSKKYPAIVKGQSIWPESFSLEVLSKIRKEGGESNFQKNYMCNPRSEVEGTIFPLQKIMECYDYDRGFTTECDGKGMIVIACDFAISNSPTADFDAYVVLEKINNFFIIKHIEVHKGFPIDAKIRRIQQIYEMYDTEDIKPKIVIDESHVGKAVSDGLISNGLGSIKQSFHSQARNSLLITLRNIIDGKKLVIPKIKSDKKADRLTDDLTVQLIGFKETKSPVTGNINYLSTAGHDDIAMALALAVKQATKQKSSGVFFASSR